MNMVVTLVQSPPRFREKKRTISLCEARYRPKGPLSFSHVIHHIFWGWVVVEKYTLLITSIEGLATSVFVLFCPTFEALTLSCVAQLECCEQHTTVCFPKSESQSLSRCQIGSVASSQQATFEVFFLQEEVKCVQPAWKIGDSCHRSGPVGALKWLP